MKEQYLMIHEDSGKLNLRPLEELLNPSTNKSVIDLNDNRIHFAKKESQDAIKRSMHRLGIKEAFDIKLD